MLALLYNYIAQADIFRHAKIDNLIDFGIFPDKTYFHDNVQLGPIPSTRTKVQFGPKQNTKVAFNHHHHHPPKTFKVVPDKLEA